MKMGLKGLWYRTFSKDAKKGQRISAQSAFLEVQAGRAVLVDVREQAELIKDGLATFALWLATSEIVAKSDEFLRFVDQLPREKKIIVYCAAGVRAGRFVEWLGQQGLEAANLGSFSDWVAAKLPVQMWEGEFSKLG